MVVKDARTLELGHVFVANLSEEDTDSLCRIPAISLTDESDIFDPEFILMWLPNEQCYGTWDGDHQTVTLFPNTTWADIAKDPAPFLGAQWDPHQRVGYQLDLATHSIRYD